MSKDYSLGVLFDEDTPFALTGELPWLNNKPDCSCIPIGEYVCKRYNSPKHGDTFEVTGVQGREGILFHKGNIPMVDSHGCILVGEQFGSIGNQVAVQASTLGFQEFRQRLIGETEFRLIVTEPK